MEERRPAIKMNVVKEISQLKENISTLENYLKSKTDPEYTYAIDLIKRGTCFVAMKQGDNEYHFYPSRFIGYENNTMNQHMNNYKDGRETNLAISKIIGYKPREDKKLEAKYREYCARLGFCVRDKGSFGAVRKYWSL